MSKNLSFTAAAVRESRNHVALYGHRGAWVVSSPYHVEILSGPRIEHQARDYQQAVLWRTRARAEVALYLMGKGDNDACLSIQDMHGGTVADMVRAALPAPLYRISNVRKVILNGRPRVAFDLYERGGQDNAYIFTGSFTAPAGTPKARLIDFTRDSE